MALENLITQHIDIWTSAEKTKSTSGRGSSKKLELYGVKKLRELILELAVQGKLVPQDPNDEPASVLLERIAQEKAQLLKEKKIKSAKALPKLGNNEIPFDIPESWNWIRLGEIGYTQTGGTPKKANSEYFGSDVPFIKPADITELEVVYDNEGLSYEGANALGRLAPSGSVLMVCIGTIGKCQIIEQDCAFNQQINSVTPFLPVGSFIFNALRSSYFRRCAWELSSSTTIAILNKGKWESIPIPLPPIAEQHRIVAKVDELMALCDQLEQQTEDSIEAHQVLVTTLLDTLTNSADADELMQNWARISEHFDTLFTTEESIDQLKQAILQLAVMGKLVPQDPSDEPASELLKRIAEEKAQLVKEKKIKKQKALPPIAEDEKPFELPSGWEWSKLQDLCFKITDGEHSTPKRAETGHYLLSARNVTNEGIILGDVDYVPDYEFARIRNRCDPNLGDILISCSGSVGRVALVDRDNAYSMVRSAAMIRPCNTNLIKEYLALMLRSPYLQFQMKNRSKQSAQANLFLGAISNLVGVIPPLSEQERIVSKVSQLLVVCDQLKSYLNDSRVTQLHLTDTIVEQVV
ncbi:restriction endonuclease subunit S [Vibrio parahaemolyticus]|nr:restriction endonuclease subunit S [Vibrio parahaemolyticus]EGR1384191.1 restriction endonuclease subunit S [Vibrio parahaemolyticus]EJG1825857.1 restriction endonuclease subunit S [Vibrio parahaemolyticus]ELA7497967.1 restriction endonuclease subunit S [Vibrio parahaemolyticus]ELA7672767.1 restriction endonuclease subunit S [Vibrio parahaemolyticus]